MAKQLNVNLAFTADTGQARAQIQNLQSQLTSLINMPSSKIGVGLEKDINKAIASVAELQVHLKNATNINTGNLDFTKLNQSIQKSGTTLKQYGQTLQSLGPQGQQAFMSLAQAVASSEVPLRRTSNLLTQMGTTLANTARWQLSSSILHGFMGAVQSAYGYAQDLNESLNNIRIVTGSNVDEMAEFAKEANKAAKALSTTTTAYTNASLIYYQQGLSKADVLERANITTKLANVSRQSAETVSNQMTAVWNNFYDGSKSLEYYADVLTSLGAATASSTEEIAQGLEKFASVAETVGLSYEYATAALATVTAETRQSADVVGTAFKTLFARLQGLKLGETLDDGTTLNSYSQALASVGVNIKTTNGELKDMDVILDETAAKWNQLSRDQQVALAQSVAGVRQYNTFMSLMSNWDVMQTNLDTVSNASGSLQEQADIYAESWEAAQKRVKAAAEKIYNSLINDEFFIDLLNSFEKILTFVDKFIDSIGGLKGVLLALGTVVTRVFQDKIASGLTNMVHNTRMFFSSTYREKQNSNRVAFINDAANSVAGINPDNEATATQQAQAASFKSQITLQQEYMANVEKMSTLEQEANKVLMDRSRILHEQAIEKAKTVEAAQKDTSSYGMKIRSGIVSANLGNTKQQQKDLEQFGRVLQQLQSSSTIFNTIDIGWQKISTSTVRSKEDLDAFKQSINDIQTSDPALRYIIDKFNKIDLAADGADEEVEKILLSLQAMKNIKIDALKSDGSIIPKDSHRDIDQLVASIDKQTRAEVERAAAVKEGDRAQKAASDGIKHAKGQQASWSDVIVKSANLAMNAAMAINMLGSAFKTLKDPDVSGWEKFTTVLMTIGTLVPTLISLFNSFQSILAKETLAKIANAAATWEQARAERELAVKKGEVSKATVKSTFQNMGEKIKGGFKSIKDFPKNLKTKWTDSYWDSLDEASQNKWIENSWGKMTDAERGDFEASYLKKNNITKTANGRFRGADGKFMKTSTVESGMKASAGKSAAGASASSGMGSLIGGGALIAAGVLVAAAAIKIGIDSYNKYDTAAQKAGEASKRAAEEARAAADAYNNLKSAGDAWTQQKNNLDNLTKGTADYEESILQANQAAMELLNTYDGLTYKMSDQHKGLIEITNLEEVRAKQMEEMQRAQSYSAFAKARADKAKLEADETKLLRKVHTGGDAGMGAANIGSATAAGAGAGALIGAGIGTIVPVIGNAVGAAVGAIIGGVGGLITGIVGTVNAGSATDAERAKMDNILKIYQEGGDTRQAIIDQFKLSATADKAQIDAIYKQIEAMDRNTEALRLSFEQRVASANENNAIYQSLDEDDQVLMDKLISKRAANAVDKNSDEYKNAVAAAKAQFKGSDQDAYDTYLKNRYGDEASNYRVTNQGGTNATLQKRNADGTWENVGEKNSLSNDEVISFNAESSLTQATEADQAYLDRLNNLDYYMRGVSKEQQQAVKASIAEGSAVDLTLWTPEQVEELKKNIENKALDMGTDMYNKINEGIKNYDVEEHKAAIRQQEIDALTSLAEKYDGCTAALERFQSALFSGDEALIKMTEDALKMEIAAEQAAEKFGMSADVLKVQAEQMAEAYGVSQEEAVQVAIKNQRMNDGVDALKENWAEWKKQLQATDKTTESYADAVVNLTKALRQLVGVSDSFKVPKGFLQSEKAMKLLEEAANGSEESIALLGAELAKSSISELAYDMEASLGFTESGGHWNDYVNDVGASFETLKDRVLNGNWVDELTNQAEYGMDAFTAAVENGTLKAGDAATMLNDQWIKDFNDMAFYANMSAQDIQDTLSAMNVSAKVDVKTITTTDMMPSTVTYTKNLGASSDGSYDSAVETWTEEGEPRAVKTSRQVASIAFDGDPDTPDITYTGGGTYSPPTSGGNNSSGQKKDRSKDKDIYYSINKQLESVRKSYEQVAKAKDRAFGADKLALIRKEIDLLEEEQRLLNDPNTGKVALAKKDYVSKGQNLKDKYGAEINEETGEITNYSALMDDMIAKAESGEISPEEYEAFLKDMTDHEEAYKLWKEEAQKAADTANAIFDAKLSEVQVELELKTGVANDKLEFINYQLENIQDQAYDAAKALSLLSQSAQLTMDKSNATRDAIADMLALHGINNMNAFMSDPDAWDDYDFTADEIANLRTWRSELLNNNKELMALKDQALEAVIGAFDEWNAKMDKNIAKFDHYSNIMNSFKNIIDIVGKDALGISDATMSALTQAGVDNANNKLGASKAKLDALKASEEETRQRLEKARAEGNETEVEALEETLEHIEEQTQAAEEEMMGNWEAALQAAADAFDQAVDSTISSFEKAMAGTFGSLEELQAGFDQATEISDRYVADYKEIYELSKLNRDIAKSMDDTDNIKGKKALKELQKEINDLQNSNVKMSQYDLDHLRKKYDLRMAEIALEEAQDAKSQVRMRRDAEGNYSYVFTADQSKIDEAQQNYEDKLYEMQELNSQYIKEMQNNILQSEIELANALRELDRTKFASDEEYYKKVNELTQYYTGQRNYYLDETNKGIENNQELVNNDWANYSATTGYKMSADEDYVDSFNETTYAQLAGYQSIEDAQVRFTKATEVMVKDLTSAFGTWEENMDKAMQAAGTSTDKFKDTMNDAVYGDGGEKKGIVDASDDAKQAVIDIATEMGKTFNQETLDKLAEFADDYEKNIKPMIEANEALVTSINNVITAQAQYDSTQNPGGTGETPPVDDNPPPEDNPPAEDNPHGKASDGNSSIKAIQWALWKLGYLSGESDVDGKVGPRTTQAIKDFQKQAKEDKYYSGIVDGILGPKTRAAFAQYGYKTGGIVDYTGLAWLDGTPSKPEYVLNAEQTQGFLRLINLLESNYLEQIQKASDLSYLAIDRISHLIDLNAGAHQIGLGRLDANNKIDNTQVLEQEVTIHAEFPNATNHSEIEEAFNTLINRASQFANRKNI